MLVYVNGVSGSGKSTLVEALRARGHVAYDADFHVSRWYDGLERRFLADDERRALLEAFRGRPLTGEEVPAAMMEIMETAAWRARYCWGFEETAVAAAMREHAPSAWFLCGSPQCGLPVVERAATHRYYLWCEWEVLAARLRERTNNPYGKTVGDLAAIREWYEQRSAPGALAGYTRLDATLRPEELAEEVLVRSGLAPFGDLAGSGPSCRQSKSAP